MTRKIDPLDLLARHDKWFLANGQGAIYAPKFPVYPDAPGFWDECYYANIRIDRLFTVLLLEDRRPIRLTPTAVDWRPDRLVKTYHAPGLTVTEERTVAPGNVFVARLRLRNDTDARRQIDLIQWSMQLRQEIADVRGLTYTVECAADMGEFCRFEQICSFKESSRPARSSAGHSTADLLERSGESSSEPRESSGVLHAVLGADSPRVSFTINLSELTAANPLWEISTCPEKFESGTLPNEVKVDVGWNQIGYIHLGQHYRLELEPGEERSITFGGAVGLDLDEAAGMLSAVLAEDPIAASERSWREYFESLPYFECSDPYLEKYYWYRWYGLRLCTMDIGQGALPFPCVAEGIDMFRHHVSYSAHVHMLECSWMPDPSLAEGSLLNFFHHQDSSGCIPGHIGLVRGGWSFYHANWGAAALQVYRIHQNREFLERAYPALARYADYFKSERDAENSDLYDVIDQNETGQEYASRYLFADEAADEWRRIQLKGVDATVYIYLLLRALAEMAEVLGRPQEAAKWAARADATRSAVREKMWDPDRALFLDVHPRTGERSYAEAAITFYPFMTDIVTADHLASIERHLLNPDEYWTRFPVPSSSQTDPYFSAEPEWKGKRMICPWNGRTWPMVNSHIVEALARASEELDPSLASRAVELMSRFIRMMFWDGDLARPNCFEHYNPLNGMPCAYRGIDDYQHSWVVDLIIKYVAGLRPGDDDSLLSLRPLPFGLDRFLLENVRYRGRTLRIEWNGEEGFSLHIDGDLAAFSKSLEPLEVKL